MAETRQPVETLRANLERLYEMFDWVETLDDELVAIALADCTAIAKDRAAQLTAGEVGWSPWGELLQRMTKGLPVRLLWGDLSETRAGRGCVLAGLDGDRYTILLQDDMKHSEWAEVLTHELCHIRRGILFTRTTPLEAVKKEEAIVNAMAAELLERAALTVDAVPGS